MKLVLYTDGSFLSFKARDFLKNHFEFEEVDADSSEGRMRLLKRTQQNSVPALEIRRSRKVTGALIANPKSNSTQTSVHCGGGFAINRSHGIYVLAGFDEERWGRGMGLVAGKGMGNTE